MGRQKLALNPEEFIMNSTQTAQSFGAPVNTLPPFLVTIDGSSATSETPSVPQVEEQIPMSAQEREQFVLKHLPMVRFVARRISERLPQHVELEELISAGVLGLIDAVAKFDGSKQVQFKSYAQFRIRGAIMDSLRNVDWGPRELPRQGRAIEEAIWTLTTRFGRGPTEAEIADELGLPLGDYQDVLGALKGLEIGSLNVEHGSETGEEELAYVPGPSKNDPLFCCLQGEMRELLIAAIDKLPEKERLVLTLYYYEELTMKEIGLTLGVVESRVSQIHSSAVLHLRSSLAAGKKASARKL